MPTWKCLAPIYAAGVLLAQPVVTFDVSPAADVGVLALTPTDPGFNEELGRFVNHPQSRLDRIEDVRPYLLILRNDSSGSIARIGMRYELKYADKGPVVWMLGWGIGGSEVIPYLGPGDRRLVFYDVMNSVSGAAATTPELLARNAAKLRESKEVVVRIDSLILVSGRIVGPDRSGNAERYTAEQRAVQDTLQHLVSLRGRGPVGAEAAREYLEALASASPRPTRPTIDAARDNVFNYQHKQKALARWFLHQGFSLDDCIAHLMSMSSKMRDLHR